ncbi:MAG: TetR/AcrR family transcriptional regulator [Polyangiaceae bacterium]|nr:TetR/AcrR family transcriptional regulator [Polyangiaceae bacterium]
MPDQQTVAQRRKARQVEAAREDILNAAAAAFARSGYRAATMQEIAKEAGFTAASLYTYFESKVAIYQALRTVIVEETFSHFDSHHSGTFEEKLTTLLTNTLSVADSRKDAFVFLMSLASGEEAAPRDAGRKPKRGHDGYIAAIEMWFGNNATPADLGGVEAETSALLLHGLVHAYFRRWLRDKGCVPLGQHAPEIARFFLRGVQGTAGERIGVA